MRLFALVGTSVLFMLLGTILGIAIAYAIGSLIVGQTRTCNRVKFMLTLGLGCFGSAVGLAIALAVFG